MLFVATSLRLQCGHCWRLSLTIPQTFPKVARAAGRYTGTAIDPRGITGVCCAIDTRRQQPPTSPKFANYPPEGSTDVRAPPVRVTHPVVLLGVASNGCLHGDGSRPSTNLVQPVASGGSIFGLRVASGRTFGDSDYVVAWCSASVSDGSNERRVVEIPWQDWPVATGNSRAPCISGALESNAHNIAPAGCRRRHETTSAARSGRFDAFGNCAGRQP